MFDLKGKIALVTGAGRGMGKAHSLALAGQGAKVIVTDIDLAECQQVVEEIKNKGGEATTFKLDVTNKTEIEKVFSEVIKIFGRLDILVNNAGIFSPKPVLELTEEDWDRMIDINLKGQFLCAQRAAQEMIKNEWGRIINISSVSAVRARGVRLPGGAHYSASKSGILGMTRSFAVEWASFGITVNAIAPGAIETPMLAQSLNEEMMKELLKKLPLNRIGKPEEVSALVVFLASKEASYVTGATFYVDGGWLAA